MRDLQYNLLPYAEGGVEAMRLVSNLHRRQLVQNHMDDLVGLVPSVQLWYVDNLEGGVACPCGEFL